jgi:hypothetical protein
MRDSGGGAVDAAACEVLVQGAHRLSSLRVLGLICSTSEDGSADYAYCGAVAWTLAHTPNVTVLHLHLCRVAQLPPLASLLHLELTVDSSLSAQAVGSLPLLVHLLTLCLQARQEEDSAGIQRAFTVPLLRLESLTELEVVRLNNVTPTHIYLSDECWLDVEFEQTRALRDGVWLGIASALSLIRWTKPGSGFAVAPALLPHCYDLTCLELESHSFGTASEPFAFPGALEELKSVKITADKAYLQVPEDAAWSRCVITCKSELAVKW